MAQIPDAPPIISLDGPEQFIARDGAGDVNVTANQIADFCNNDLNLTPAEVLAKVVTANPQINGLNANFLQGLTASFFQNASNLNAGTVQNARLPLGEFDYSWSSGGFVTGEGSLKCKWKIPLFLSDGVPSAAGGLMLQFGWTIFVTANTKVYTSFLEPFSSFLGPNNKPLIFISPECSGDSTHPPEQAVELDMRLIQQTKTLSGFECSSIRTKGANTDLVRGNWLAIGFYS